MKLRPLMFFLAVSSLHNVSKAATARRNRLGFVFAGRQHHCTSCFVPQPQSGSIHQRKPIRLRPNRRQSYSSLRHQRSTFSAASSDTSGSSGSSGNESERNANINPSRSANDYDNAFFAPVLPKEAATSKFASSRSNEGYGFHDNSDYDFDNASDDSGSGYNWFDDDGTQSDTKGAYGKKQLERGTVVKTSARILQSKQSPTSASVSSTPDNAARSTPNEESSSSTAPRILPKKSSEYTGTLPRNNKETVISCNDKNERFSSQRERSTLQTSNANSSTTYAESLLHQIEHLTRQIYQLNNCVEFNVDSPKQVSRVLFGEEGSSTNKDALEALASVGNQMAACIYKHRKLSREYKRELKRMQQIEKGDRKNDYYGNLARKRGTAAVEKGSAQTDGAKLESDNKQREPLLLIDTSAYIFRAYHAIPPLHHSDGTPTGAVHGVCRMLQNLLLSRVLKGDRPRVVLVFDSKGSTFRHKLFPEYKANRGPCPEDLIPQFELVREAADAFGIVQIEAEGYEADDVIATLTRHAVEEGVDVDIFSGDKDLMQLITPEEKVPSVNMIDPMHFDRVSHSDVIEKWGVSSEKLGDVLALAGDSSDNIPGVPGIGPKIAATLIDEYGTLDNLIEQADSIKQKKRRESLVENADKALLYRKLVTLDETIPTEQMTLPYSYENVSDFRMSAFDPNKLIDFYTRLELNSCKNHLQHRLRSNWTFDYKAPPTPEEYEGVPF